MKPSLILIVLFLVSCASIYPDYKAIDDFKLIADKKNCGKSVEEIVNNNLFLDNTRTILYQRGDYFIISKLYDYDGNLKLFFKKDKLSSITFHWAISPDRLAGDAYASLRPLNCSYDIESNVKTDAN